MDIKNESTKLNSWEYFLLRAAHKMSLSANQYETISNRYDQLQKILSGSDNPLLSGAHIFVQGSIGLRTTIKPVSGAPEGLNTVDADAIVWLPNARNAASISVLDAIEECFQAGSRVQEDIQQLRRGIRIVYADQDPGFHIDITPARSVVGNKEVNGEGMLEVPDREIGWKASSPLPYSSWLNVASTSEVFLESRAAIAKSLLTIDGATQDPLPDYQSYVEEDPLRATIKLLKRHRDEWAIKTETEDYRPISAVITTLATHAYLDVAEESKLEPLRPLEAIIKIVERMNSHIKFNGKEYQVCNPKDNGENFAEKWNRPLEGVLYRDAFLKWHENAIESISLGLKSYNTAESFAEAIRDNFGIGSSFITEVNNEIPANWTMPGRPEGTSKNFITAGALLGGSINSAHSQAAVKPIDRLG